jgi:hypothetical protein
VIFRAKTPDESRAIERFALGMELRFSYKSSNVIYIGSGRTRDLSGNAICFETDQELQNRTELEIRIPWPARLQDVCPLELVVRGSLIRKEAAVAVVEMKSCEFQTAGERSFDHPATCGVTCNIVA